MHHFQHNVMRKCSACSIILITNPKNVRSSCNWMPCLAVSVWILFVWLEINWWPPFPRCNIFFLFSVTWHVAPNKHTLIIITLVSSARNPEALLSATCMGIYGRTSHACNCDSHWLTPPPYNLSSHFYFVWKFILISLCDVKYKFIIYLY